MRLVDFYLSGELPADQRQHVAEHLADCWDCGDRVDVHVRIREIVARKCGEATSRDLMIRVRSMIEQEPEADPGPSTA
jgi:anti-sigma factor (TIGR02949 family)